MKNTLRLATLLMLTLFLFSCNNKENKKENQQDQTTEKK